MNEREREILLILQEESAEVIQAVSKVFRFGWDSEWDGQTNREHLEEEVGDYLAMVQIMVDTGMLDTFAIDTAKQNKIEKLKKWSSIFK
jgi:NTP pyrophosphatase (non-canonical NTP hydrolase)